VARQNPERTYPAPREQTWRALLGVIGGEGKWQVLEQDPAAGTVTFNTGTSMSSWYGQDMTVHISDLGDGRSRVTVGGSIARRGLSTFQVYSWGEKGRIARMVLQRLGDALGSGSPGPP
jgi:hypothetical protein